LKNKRQILLVLTALIAFPAIAYLDRRTGLEFNFAFFYLLTIVSLTWYGGRTVGYVLIAIGTLVIITFDYYRQQNDVDYGIVVWDSFWSMMTLFLGVLLINRLRMSLEREKSLSRTDSLTGLNNRRYFREIAEDRREWCRRHGVPLTLAYVDLDNFKTVNDTLGHDEGDRLLVSMAGLMKQNLRQTDLVARIGGDEFILLLPEADEALARAIIQRMQGAIQQAAEGQSWPVTASVGLVTDPHCRLDCEKLIHRADELMYKVKQAGKGTLLSDVIEGA